MLCELQCTCIISSIIVATEHFHVGCKRHGSITGIIQIALTLVQLQIEVSIAMK